MRARRVGEEADAAQQVAIRHAGRDDDHLAGRELLEREGAPPAQGAEIELGEARFVVTKLGRSPLARDTRPCAYLQTAA